MSTQKVWGSFPIPPHPYWLASTPKTHYPALEEDIEVDVAVIGGGIVGITSAFLLKNEGLKVALIEADHIVQGTTGHTTAKLTAQHSLIYDKIKRSMGEEKARLYADANTAAIDFVERLIGEKNIDCDFHRCPAYVYTHDDQYIQKIEDEANTAVRLGIKAEFIKELPLPFLIKAAVRFDEQARFHPRKYLLALSKEIQGDGSAIFEKTRVVDVKEGNPCTLTTEHGKKVRASQVIMATQYPFYDKPGLYFTRLYPMQSYILGVKIKGEFPEGMYITAEQPKRSLRYQEDEGSGLVLVAGESHKTGQGEEMTVHYENLKHFAQQTFNVVDIPYRWSTRDYVTPDEVPYIGPMTADTPHVYVATGFRKWGMTHGTVAGLMIRDFILKGESAWAAVYNPSRFTPVASFGKFVAENANVAKEFVTGKLSGAGDNIEDIKPKEAGIIWMDGKRIGVYRDESGQLHSVDTTCTHLGCELQWNAAEASWDCPCHGSRFTYEGEIVGGPAVKNIKKVSIEENASE